MVMSPLITTPLSRSRLTRSRSECGSEPKSDARRPSSATFMSQSSNSPTSLIVDLAEVISRPGAGELQLEPGSCQPSGFVGYCRLKPGKPVVPYEEGGVKERNSLG